MVLTSVAKGKHVQCLLLKQKASTLTAQKDLAFLSLGFLSLLYNPCHMQAGVIWPFSCHPAGTGALGTSGKMLVLCLLLFL